MKIVYGVYKWSDGQITAAAMREEMFEQAKVELLAETFFMPEAIELAIAWKNGTTRFVKIEEFFKLNTSSLVVHFQIIGEGIAKVRFAGEYFVYYIAKEM